MNLKWLFLLLICATATACSTRNEPSVNDSLTPKRYHWDTLALGGDLSYVNVVEQQGGKFYDKGAAADPFQILKAHGGNIVRVRLWHTPSWQFNLQNKDVYSDLDDATRCIERAKQAGLAVLLDIHYSDIWADPAHQTTPAAWVGLDAQTLGDSVYRYTASVLQHLHQRGLSPEMIQVGNENNTGIMHPIGKIENGNYTAFAALIQRGIQAVRDFSTSTGQHPRIVLHVAQYIHALPFIEGITKAGVTDFDILGISHYEKWSEGYSLKEVESITRQLISTYGKKVMVVETACPWTKNNADTYANIVSGDTPFAGFPVTAQGQRNYLLALTQAVVNGGGCGVIYWEPAWITSTLNDSWGKGSSWENCALFDFEGNALQGLDFMEFGY